MKVKEVANTDGSHHSWAVKCPGCGDYHCFDNRWSFNGNMEKPTFRDSMLSTSGPAEDRKRNVCHSYVTDGQIKFLDDCTHALKGQTIDLLDIDPNWNS